MKITRRDLAAALAGAPLLAAAQRPPAPTPEDDLKAARDRIKSNGETLAAQNIPMSTEPAFQFRA